VLNDPKWSSTIGQVWNKSKHAGGCKHPGALTNDKVKPFVSNQARKCVARTLWLKDWIVWSELAIES
jgi:hypothetical protein